MDLLLRVWGSRFARLSEDNAGFENQLFKGIESLIGFCGTTCAAVWGGIGFRVQLARMRLLLFRTNTAVVLRPAQNTFQCTTCAAFFAFPAALPLNEGMSHRVMGGSHHKGLRSWSLSTEHLGFTAKIFSTRSTSLLLACFFSRFRMFRSFTSACRRTRHHLSESCNQLPVDY